VRYGFLLLPEFPIYALIPAIEALRIANQNRGRKLYSWHLFSPDGRPIKCGNGMSVPVEAAMADVEKLTGLVGSSNMITIRPAVMPGNVKARIEDALKRQALVEADAIHVTTQGGKVTLDGKVHSWSERNAARAAAWQAPGVIDVVDNLQIAAF